MNRSVIKEWIKSILIVLLLCSALVLAVMATSDGFFPDWKTITGMFRANSGTELQEQTLRAQTAARPVQLSVRTTAGRASAMYDAQSLDEAYEQFGGLLGQALETVDSVQQSNLRAVQEALVQPSVYFAYPGAVPLSALAQWLEAECGGTEVASWFVLSVQSDAVRLYYGAEDAVYTGNTYLPTDRLLQEIERFRPDGSSFAFEQEELSCLAPLTLVDGGSHPIYQAEAASAYDETFVSSTASLLGFNPYGDGFYTEADGTVVFSEVGGSLRIEPDGTVKIANQNADNSRFQAADASAAAAIEAARALLDDLTSGNIGEAALCLSEYSVAADQMVTLRFSYYLNGIPVYSSSGAAATVTLKGAVITALTVRVRDYALRPEPLVLLPVRQAQALAGEEGRMEIAYADTGDGAMSAGWVS